MEKVLGPYRLTRLIHQGNSSQIWEATEGAARVAVKFLRTDFRENKAELALFKNEFEIGEQMSHPNIIKMLKADMEFKVPYFAMELFSSISLKAA